MERRWVFVPALAAALLLVAAATLVVRHTAHPAGNPRGAPNARVVPGALAPGSTMREPPVVSSHDGLLQMTLHAASGTVEIADQQVQSPSAFDGQAMGPTLIVRPGDTIEITLDNDLNQMTNIHFHGLHVSPRGISDNVLRHMPAGGDYRVVVQIPTDQHPGLYWYHAHMHRLVEEQVNGGLAGLILVDGLTDLLPEDLQGAQQRFLALKNFAVRSGELVSPNTENETITVNGQVRPRIPIAPGQTQLWHIANISADRFYDLTLGDNAFTVVAQDGNPVWDVWSHAHLTVAPGARFDVLVTGPAAGSTKLGTRPFDEGFDHWKQARVATLISSGAPQQAPAMPQNLVPEDDLAAAPVARHRKFVFSVDEKKGKFLINGETFDPDRVDVAPRLGTVEQWRLVNDSTELHPFHIHVNPFRVMRVNGRPYDAHGEQDVVTIPIGGSVVIRQRFADFTGEFVFHCHILFHEDNGMMATVRVHR